jgi:hypothetical protein
MVATRQIPIHHPVALVKKNRSSGLLSTFPDDFTPNPGGQERFFDWVGLNGDRVNPEIRFAYLRGGVGAGKTMCGAAFICMRAFQDPLSRSLITANTYGQLETSTIPGFVEFCWRHNIEISPSRETVEETAKAITFRRLCTITIRTADRICKASILVLSAEAFTARTIKAKTPGAGLQVRSIWADEFSTADKSAFDILNDRLGRGEGTLKGLGVITSTINKYQPYNWTYDLFDNPNRNDTQKELFRSVVVKTTENTALDKEYYSSVAAGLTEEHRLIQLESEYVAVTKGRLISSFVRSVHALFGKESSALEPDPSKPLHLAFDFNRSPATATAWQVIGDEVRGVREWYLLESSTYALGEEIASWVKSVKFRQSTYIYGDASGAQKTANSRKTNWQIVYDSFNRHGLAYTARVPKANPDIQDSVNGLNLKFSKDEIFINGDTMPELLKDLESVQWDEKQPGKINKSDPMRTHPLDGLRYFIWQIAPYKSLPRAKSDQDIGQRRIKGIVY